MRVQIAPPPALSIWSLDWRTNWFPREVEGRFPATRSKQKSAGKPARHGSSVDRDTDGPGLSTGQLSMHNCTCLHWVWLIQQGYSQTFL
jgi:hypothetical protein